MRMSYAIPHSNGRFYLPTRIREWLQLSRESRLHGRLIDTPNGPDIILSPIPIEHWDNCFRVIINTCERVGAMHAALEAIQNVHLNVLHMVAAAASPAGDLTITAIAAHMPLVSNPDPSPKKSPNQIATQLEKALIKSTKDWISNASIYDPESDSGLKSVRVSPLLVLRAFSNASPANNGMLSQRLGKRHSPNFSINVHKGLIDLRKESLSISKKNDSPSVFSMMHHSGVEKSVSLAITVDPDEYHFRIGFLPPRPYMTIDIPLSVSSDKESSMMGITKELVSVFKSLPCPVNLYYSSAITVEATTSASPRPTKSKCTERLRIRFVGDVTNIIGESQSQMPSLVIPQAIEEAIQKLSGSKHGTGTKRKVVFDTQNSRGVTVRPLLAPLVFTATNAKPGMEPEYIQMALDLFAMLKDLHLRPVFVPTITGAATAQAQMTSLLSVSPMLVSLYLPEKHNKLESKRSVNDADFSPSAWTLFEEAYMMSLGGRQVFRLLHEDVYQPPFIEPTSVLRFSSSEEYQCSLSDLRARIVESMEMDEWRTALVDCSTKLALRGVDLQRIDRSDPETWLINQQNKLLDDVSDQQGTGGNIKPSGSPEVSGEEVEPQDNDAKLTHLTQDDALDASS